MTTLFPPFELQITQNKRSTYTYDNLFSFKTRQ